MILTSRIPATLRTFLVGLLLVPGLLAASTPAQAVSDVVISQVYGGGGSLYTHDFIELHNRGNTPVVVNGWSIQVHQGAGTWTGTVLTGPLTNIPAGGYYLVRGAAGAGGGSPLPTPDQVGTTSIGATSGIVALVNNSNLLSGLPPINASGIVDKLGYGAVTYFEGAPAGALTASTAAFRLTSGCQDTDNNSNDFSVNLAPAPRNSASPVFQCQFTLTYLAGLNGSISGTTPQTVAHGANGSPVTAVANTGYHFVSWSDGVLTADRTDLNVTANITATATFALTEHTLTYLAGLHGTISGTTPQTVPDGGNGTQVTAVADLGYHFVSWSDGGPNASRTELNVTADLTVTASFEINLYTLTYSAGVGGTISGTTPQTVPHGGSGTAVTAVANPGRHFVRWSDNVLTATRTDGPVTAHVTVSAEFALNEYTLTYNAGPGGTISGTTPQTVTHGGSGTEVTAVPNVGYHFVKWSDDLGTAKRTDSPVTADLTVTAQFAEKKVVVSQIYGGGGETGATLTHDFVELFNQGEFAVNIKDWTVQYTSATGTTWTTTPLDGVIQPHSYFLVQQAAGAGGSTPLPAPDATGTTNLDAFAGKVALVSSTTALSGSCPTGDPIEDMVGYGAADCSESSPALSPTNTTAALRKFRGCIDTDNNSADFIAGTPDPRNSASPVNTCTFTLTLVVSPPGSGTVTASPNQVTFAAGAPVQLTAAPSLNPPAYHFDHWSGVEGGSVNPLVFNMDSDKTVTAHFVSNTSAGQIVISQFFGGGGDLPSGLKNDYVELYNRGSGTVNVGGWSIQFAAATSTVWNLTPLFGNIPPGKHLLVKCFAGGSGNLDLIPADVIGALDVGATAGKLALVSNAIPLTGQSCPSPGPGIVDFVGYGGADCSETSPAGATSASEAGFRDNGGCEETNNNLADFSNGPPDPHNSATPAHFCDIWLDAGTRPAELALSMPMPNPSRGRFNFSFGLPVEGEVRVTISDIQGRRIASLVDGRLPAGHHNLSWTGVGDAGPVRSGLYYLALEHKGQRIVRRFVLVR